MTVHTVLRMGDRRLFQVAAPVVRFSTPELAELITDMFETMRAAGGCGLAAPQIGVCARVLVFGLQSSTARAHCETLPDTVLINPEIEIIGDQFGSDWEGCLSVPGMRGRVDRPDCIRYRAYDLDGRLIERQVCGFQARVIQHECDHLDGILYPSRIRDWQAFGFVDAMQDEGAAPSAAISERAPEKAMPDPGAL